MPLPPLRRRLAGIGMTLALALAPLAAFAQTANYDGTYSGKMTLTLNNAPNRSSTCLGGPFDKTLTVKSGAFTFVYNSTFNIVVTGTVRPDGTLSGSGTSSAGGASLSGKIQGNVLTGQVSSAICEFALQLRKS